MAKWVEKPWWKDINPYSTGDDHYDAMLLQRELGEIAGSDFSYARNVEGGLSFFAKGVPVGSIANRDLIRLIQQAADCLQANKVAE